MRIDYSAWQGRVVFWGGLLLVVGLLVSGLAIGWWLFAPETVVETPAAAERQGDGSLVAARQPDAKAKPRHQVPKGSTVERTGSFTVKPAQPAGDVQLDWSLVRMPDQTRRMIGSSADGEVVAGVDIPVETAAPPPEPKVWAVGLSYDPAKQTPGIWIERDIWRVRVGLDVNQTRPVVSAPTDIEARLRVGFTF